MLNNELKEAIIEAVKEEYEYGHSAEIDEIKEFIDECGLAKNEEEKEEAIDFYEELQQLGPTGMLEEYPDLDWDENFLEEYGDNEDEEYDEIEEEE